MAKTFPLAVIISAVDKISGPISRISGKLAGLGATASALGAKMTLGVTAPVVAGFTLITKSALETDSALDQLRNTSEATAAELGEAFKRAQQIAGPFNPADRISALTQLVKLGLSLNQANEALPVTANLAIAAESELADASLGAIKVLRAYGLELKQLGRVTDVLAGANAKSPLGLASLSQEIVALAPLARSLGLEIDDVAAAVISLAQVNAAPTSVLRAALTSLIQPSKAAAEALVRLGIRREDLFSASGELRDISSVVELLGKSGAKAGDLVEIFGKRAGPGMVALLNQGGEALRKTRESISRTGLAAKQASEGFNGAEASLAGLRNSWHNLSETIAQAGVLAEVEAITRGVAGMISKINDLDPRLIQWGVRAVSLAAVLGPLAWGIGKVALAVNALRVAWVAFEVAMAPAVIALGVPAAVIGGLLIAIPLLIIYWDELTAAVENFGKALDRWAEPLQKWLRSEVINTKGWKAFEFFAGAGTGVFDASRGNRVLSQSNDLRSSPVAPGEASVLVRFEGAPAGTQARVLRQSGMDVGVDMGWAMQGD